MTGPSDQDAMLSPEEADVVTGAEDTLVDDKGGQISDTDIVFDCPHCGHGLVIDYRGAGLVTNCTECGKPVQVPIPDGMQLVDLDQAPEELEAQVVNFRRALFKSEQRVRELEEMVASIKDRRTTLERSRAVELHRLADVRTVCEHIQRSQSEIGLAVNRILELIAGDAH